MAANINRLIAFVFISIASFLPQARGLSVQCEKNGILTAVTADEKVEFSTGSEVDRKNKYARDKIADVEEVCNKLAECFEQFPAAGTLSNWVVESMEALSKKIATNKSHLVKQDPASEEFTETFELLKRNLERCEGQRNELKLPKLKAGKDGFIKITSERGLNKNKEGDYEKKALREVIRAALQQGVDPYAALGITLIENPPAASRIADFYIYAKQFGMIPVDQTGAYDAMGCLPLGRNYSKYISAEKIAQIRKIELVITAPDRLIQTDGEIASCAIAKDGLANIALLMKDPGSYTKKVMQKKQNLEARVQQCEQNPEFKKYQELKNAATFANEQRDALVQESIAKAKDPAQAKLEVESEVKCLGNAECRGVVRPNAGISFDFPVLEGAKPQKYSYCVDGAHAKLAAGPDLIPAEKALAKKTCCGDVSCANCPQSERGLMLRSALGIKYVKTKVQECIATGKRSVSYCLQKYNGLGCFGCTEKMKNDCYYKLILADSPIYGARVGDLVVNSLMANDAINELVAEEAAFAKKSVVSMLCLRSGRGGHSVNKNSYFQEQRRILGGRAACKKYF